MAISSHPVDPDLVAFAGRLADASGAVIRRYFRQPFDVEAKPDASPVTIADRAAEQAIRSLIADHYPRHGIFGEEHGRERLDADFVWVIDPIDGTKSFISGVPLFGTLIALVRDGRPVLGVIDQPISGERWVGGTGHPTTLNGVPARVRTGVPLSRASLFTTSPDMFDGATAPRYDRLRTAAGLVRHGADCYAAGLLASGHVDLVCEGSLQPYDWCALVPVIENAGGIATDWAGEPLGIASDGLFLAAGDPGLHREALALLAP